MSARPRVFLSYSREPRENAEFARAIARVLRAHGFDPCLDEEQVAVGADPERVLRETIQGVQHGLFVVTGRWFERDATRLELSLFAARDRSTHRTVAVLREKLDGHPRVAELGGLNVIEWFPDDPEPDARMWQVFAAVSGQRPGPAPEWAEKGRQLTGVVRPPGADAPPPVPPGPAPVSVREWVACAEPPVLALAAGEESVLLTDCGWCFRVGADRQIVPGPQADTWSGAAVAPDGTCVVGQYRGMLARLRGDKWEYRAIDAAVLAVAASDRGVVVGDAAGTVTLFPGSDGRRVAFPFGHPVVELVPTGNGVTALGADGALGYLDWDDQGAGFEPVAVPAGFDRPVGLFGLLDQARVGVFSAHAVAVLDTESGRLRVGKQSFPDGVRTVVSVGWESGYFAVLTDSGRLYVLDHNLDSVYPVLIPGDAADVIGLCRAGAGVLAWTTGGALFAVGRDRTVRTLVRSGIALVWPDPDDPGQWLAVRWNPDRGIRVQTVRLDPAK